MSLSMKVDLSGLAAFEALFFERVSAVVEAEANSLAADISAAAPVLTGALRDSIAATQEDAFHWEVHDGGNDHPEVDYGVHVNYGSQGRAANPFFSRELDRHRDGFADKVAEAVREACQGR